MTSILKNWRTEAGMTQEQAAALAGVTNVAWHFWENGNRRLPAERVPILSKITGIPRDVLRPDVFGELQ
jgi:transcriptional regulator with XRE-family HTH domain